MQETATPGEFQVPHQCEDKGPSTYAPTIASKKQREPSRIPVHACIIGEYNVSLAMLPKMAATSGKVYQLPAPLKCEDKGSSTYDQANTSKKQREFSWITVCALSLNKTLFF